MPAPFYSSRRTWSSYRLEVVTWGTYKTLECALSVQTSAPFSFLKEKLPFVPEKLNT